MAISSTDNPASWRLRTPNGVPYRVLGTTGGFGPERSTVQVRVLVQGSRLVDFIENLLPPAEQQGYISYPTAVSLEGLPTLVVKNITFKSQDTELPIDPFGFDAVGAASYYPILELVVDYDSQIKQKEPVSNDPFSFLEISAAASGEFYHIPANGAKWQKLKNPDLGEDGDDETPSANYMSDPKASVLTSGALGVPDGDPEPVREPDIPTTITVPMTEWTVRWPQIPYVLFKDVMINRLRMCMGRVNKETLPILYDAPPETILFAGWSLNEQYTWRSGFLDKPPVNVEMKFLEKRIIWDGVIMGHNQLWRPKQGWQTILIDGENKMFKSWDMNQLFFV